MNNMKRWITVSNFETQIILGVYPKEQTKPQKVIINVTLEVEANIHNDNIKNVLSYEKIISESNLLNYDYISDSFSIGFNKAFHLNK